jgi:hypothetical protein
MRNADLRSEGRIRAVQIRTWALDVPLDGLVEISFDIADQFSITADELVADDRNACQQLGAELRATVPGLIVPSAALPGTRNVILFGPRVAAHYLTQPVNPLDIPASITADFGRPLSSPHSEARAAPSPPAATTRSEQKTASSRTDAEAKTSTWSSPSTSRTRTEPSLCQAESASPPGYQTTTNTSKGYACARTKAQFSKQRRTHKEW